MKTNFIENNKRFWEHKFMASRVVVFAIIELQPRRRLCAVRCTAMQPTLSLQTNMALGAMSHVPLLHNISCNDVDRYHYTKL